MRGTKLSNTKARNRDSKSRRAAPDRPMGGRFLTVLRLIYPTPKRINKLAPTDGPMPTRGRALPFVARSQGLVADLPLPHDVPKPNRFCHQRNPPILTGQVSQKQTLVDPQRKRTSSRAPDFDAPCGEGRLRGLSAYARAGQGRRPLRIMAKACLRHDGRPTARRLGCCCAGQVGRMCQAAITWPTLGLDHRPSPIIMT